MYINEATDEVVKKDESRLGKIKAEKHISGSLICQDGKVSSSKIVVMDDDLSSSVPVQLNIVGTKDEIEEAGGELVAAPFGVC